MRLNRLSHTWKLVSLFYSHAMYVFLNHKMTIKLIFKMSVLDNWLLYWSYTMIKVLKDQRKEWGSSPEEQEWDFKISHRQHLTLLLVQSYNSGKEREGIYIQLMCLSLSHCITLVWTISFLWRPQTEGTTLLAGTITVSKLSLAKIPVNFPALLKNKQKAEGLYCVCR